MPNLLDSLPKTIFDATSAPLMYDMAFRKKTVTSFDNQTEAYTPVVSPVPTSVTYPVRAVQDTAKVAHILRQLGQRVEIGMVGFIVLQYNVAAKPATDDTFIDNKGVEYTIYVVDEDPAHATWLVMTNG